MVEHEQVYHLLWIYTHTEVIGDKIEGRSVMLNLSIKASQVEAIENVILFDLAEVLVALI
jgi:hypothetical protein